MLSRLRKIVLFLFIPQVAICSTFTLNVLQPGGSTSYTNMKVIFELKNYGSVPPIQIGTGVIVPSTQTFYPNLSGLVTGTLIGNDLISPSNTYYVVRYYNSGTLYYQCNLPSLIGNGPWNLNNYQCVADVNTPPSNPPDINIWHNGTYVTNRSTLNFIDTGITFTFTDDPTNNKVDIKAGYTGNLFLGNGTTYVDSTATCGGSTDIGVCVNNAQSTM